MAFEDVVMVTWEPALVEPFCNHEFVPEPDGLKERYFDRKVESVQDFGHRVSNLPDRANELLQVLLGGLGNPMVGKYSNFHDNAVYSKGYMDPETVRLAYMYVAFSVSVGAC